MILDPQANEGLHMFLQLLLPIIVHHETHGRQRRRRRLLLLLRLRGRRLIDGTDGPTIVTYHQRRPLHARQIVVTFPALCDGDATLSNGRPRFFRRNGLPAYNARKSSDFDCDCDCDHCPTVNGVAAMYWSCYW